MKPHAQVFLLFVSIIIAGFVLGYSRSQSKTTIVETNTIPTPALIASSPTQTPTPSLTPTPTPLSFEQMNKLYGPCARVPTLMYHHIQDPAVAKEQGHPWLAVDPAMFRGQLDYLESNGYTAISMAELIAFFDTGSALPSRPILLTFDDGYDNFYTNAYPVLSEKQMNATVFVPTGLMDNPGYLSWDTIRSMVGNGRILFANHTWSHKNVLVHQKEMEQEILTADKQLTEHDAGRTKVFSYPYGLADGRAQTYLAQLGYQLAFTTRWGSTLCRGQRLDLPRIRIGNSSLQSYGL